MIADLVKQKVCTLYSVFISFIIEVEMYISEFFSFLEKKLETKANIINIHQITPIEATLKLNAYTFTYLFWAWPAHGAKATQ